MERVAFLTIYMMTCCIQSFPIDNGFTVKLKPLSVKQDLKPKTAGTVFAKPPEDTKLNEEQSTWDVLNKFFFTQLAEAEREHTDQQAKLGMPPKRSAEQTVGDMWPNNKMNYLNLPVISQPYNDYKVLVATAPPNIKMGTDKKKMVVYVVFPNDASNSEPVIDDIPTIYFVNQNTVKRNLPRKEDLDPILIVDSNRTVTGLKSKEVPKFVRFKNKLTNRFNYNITR